MANLGTHLNVAAVVGGGLGLIGLGEWHWSLKQACVTALLVTLGGVLPDIDVDHSKVSKGLFSSIGVGVVLAILDTWNPLPNTGLLLLCMFGLWAAIRWGGWYLFTRHTIHRGIFHSLLALIFFSAVTVGVAYNVVRVGALWAWFSGIAVGLGCFIHLALDEVYSVDFKGSRLKRSFGSALKPWDFRNPLNSLALAAMTGVLVWCLPSARPAWYWFKSL
jgi:membrane-bound metal-dependent hydrolase YbcI (DUF457 family)